MLVKSFLLESDINIINKYKSILIYGENEGLKKNILQKIKRLNDIEIIDLTNEEIDKSDMFRTQSTNLSLFNKKRIILVTNPKESFLDHVKDFLNNNNDIKLVIISELLSKKSNIRNFYETEKNIIIVPCYNDTQVTLSNIIRKELSHLNGLTPSMINQILEKTGNERIKVDEEINKIKLYFLDKKVTEDELEKLLNYNLEINFNELVSDILLKNIAKINSKFDKLDISREEVFLFFGILINQLDKIKFILLNAQQKQITQSVLTKLNIKIFWKEQITFLAICNKLNLSTVEKMQTICFTNEILLKKNYDIDYLPIFKKTILDLVQN